MNRLNAKTRAQVISCLLEGCSIRSTVRMTGVAKKTVSRLLVEAGAVAAEYQDRVMRNLPCRRIQVDEVGLQLLQATKRDPGDSGKGYWCWRHLAMGCD